MKTIGIIGGMGPLATIDLFRKLVENTPAGSDQEHLPILVANIPQIPDRTASILEGGESPVPAITKIGRDLESIGADFLLLPCNTSHYYFDEIQAGLSIPVLNMVELTCHRAKRLGYKKVAVLGTEGTLKTGIYQTCLEKKGIKNVPIPEKDMHLMSYVIYDIVKAGDFTKDIERFRVLIEDLKSRGAEALILGCTELPVLFNHFHLNYNTIDPTDILALEAVREALKES